MVSNGLLSLRVLDLSEEFEHNIESENQFEKCVSDEYLLLLKVNILLCDYSQIVKGACEAAACFEVLPGFQLAAVHGDYQALAANAQPMPLLFVDYNIDDPLCLVIVLDGAKVFEFRRQRLHFGFSIFDCFWLSDQRVE